MPPSLRFRNIITNLSVSIFTILLLLFCIEILISIIVPQNLSGVWITISKRGYHLNKDLITVQHEHKVDNRKVTYRFNKWHLRGGEINKKARKVLALGDSFTFGWLLDEENTYLSLLQKKCNTTFGKDQIQILNGATGGWGLVHCLNYLEEFGDRIQPDLVLIYFNTDDLGRSLYKNTYDTDSNFHRAKETIKYLSIYQWALQHSHLLQWCRSKLNTMGLIGIRGKYNVKTDKTQPIIPNTSLEEQEVKRAVNLGRELFLEINKWCTKRNIELLVFTTGWHFQLDSQNISLDPEIIFLEQADSFFKVQKIPFYDFTPLLVNEIKGNEQNYIIKGDHHPNEKGAVLVAKYSWEKLFPILQHSFGLK